MKRFYELASRVSAQVAVVAMLLGLMLAGSSQALADEPVTSANCVKNCSSTGHQANPPCAAAAGSSCVPKAGEPNTTVCGCSYGLLMDSNQQAVGCAVDCVGAKVIGQPI